MIRAEKFKLYNNFLFILWLFGIFIIGCSTPLKLNNAIKISDLETVKKIIEKGADVSAANENGTTTL